MTVLVSFSISSIIFKRLHCSWIMIHHTWYRQKPWRPIQTLERQIKFAIQTVTTTQSAIEPVQPSLINDESTADDVDIDNLRIFYQLWSVFCLFMVILAFLVLAWVRKNRRQPLQERKKNGYYQNTFPTKSLI